MEGDDAHKEANHYRKKPVFRRPNRRCTYIIIASAVVFLILVIVLSVQLSGKSKDDCPEGIHCNWHSMPPSEFLKDKRCDSICTTEECLKSAHYALSRFDATKDPCEDFYEFACGTYETNIVLGREDNQKLFTYQETQNEVFLNLKGIIDSVERTPGEKRLSLLVAKKVYEDCLLADLHPDVIMKTGWKKMFAVDGPFPWLLQNDDDDGEFNQNSVIKMMSSTLFYEGNPFFEDASVVQETVNPGNKSRWNIRFTNYNIEELISIYKEAAESEDASDLFNRGIVVMSTILLDAGVDADKLKDFVTDILKFEKSYVDEAAEAINFRNKLYEKNPHLRNENHTYSCQDLDHQMKHIKWCAIAKQILENYGLQSNSSIGITILAPMDYVKAVDKVLSETEKRTIINYLGLKFIMKHLKYMQSPLKDMYYDNPELFPRMNNILTETSRWQQCVEIVSEFLWVPLEREYLKEKLDGEKRAKVRHMVKKLKEAHISLLDKMTWMHDMLPGAEIKEMIKKMDIVLGHSLSAAFEQDKELDRFIQKTSVPTLLSEERSTLIKDVLELKRLRRIARVSSDERVVFILSKRMPMFGFFKDIFRLSTIDIAYGELAFPLFLPGRPMYMEYAAFGSRISTFIVYLLSIELLKDSTRIKAIKTYLDTAKCLNEQHYLLKTGETTYKDEDNTKALELFNAIGTLASLEAYKKYVDDNGEEKGLPGLPFTNQQLFFISNAQTQCEKFSDDVGYANFPRELMLPARFRVNVAFANSKDFVQAFRCPVGSSMNPKKKCCVLGNGKSSEKCH